MNIYAFYKPASAGLRDEEERGMVAKWKESWFRYGWNPIVLGMDDIIKDELYNRLISTVKNFPSPNPLPWHLSTWIRWAAWAQIKDDLFAIGDYDVINYGFTPEMSGNEPVITNEVFSEHDFTIQTPATIMEFVDITLNIVPREMHKFVDRIPEMSDEGRPTYALGDGEVWMALNRLGLNPVKKFLPDGMWKYKLWNYHRADLCGPYVEKNLTHSLIGKGDYDMHPSWYSEPYYHLPVTFTRFKDLWDSGNVLHLHNKLGLEVMNLFFDELKDYLNNPDLGNWSIGAGCYRVSIVNFLEEIMK